MRLSRAPKRRVQVARQVGAEHLTRPQLVARLFNGAPVSIGIAGTGGKSTVTAMMAWILHEEDLDPTVIVGAVMKTFATPQLPFASALAGRGGVFVSEVDESDGSIALYHPTVAVLNTISLDHRTIEELRSLFRGFVGSAGAVVLNVDDAETRALATTLDIGTRCMTFSLSDPDADLRADAIVEEPLAVSFTLVTSDANIPVRLQVPGRHNVSNALASIAGACGGTVDRAVGSADIVAGVWAAGRRAEHVSDRATCGARLKALACRGDRIVVMGARDDSLSVFAQKVLEHL